LIIIILVALTTLVIINAAIVVYFVRKIRRQQVEIIYLNASVGIKDAIICRLRDNGSLMQPAAFIVLAYAKPDDAPGQYLCNSVRYGCNTGWLMVFNRN